jgi:hypothetical protein
MHFNKTSHLPTPSTHVSRQTICGRTSTSPSGQHLGYYKSIAAFESTSEDDDTPRVSDRIFGVLANSMVDAALQTGFVFERWRKIVNAMIGNCESFAFSRPTCTSPWELSGIDASWHKARNWGPSATNNGAPTLDAAQTH